MSNLIEQVKSRLSEIENAPKSQQAHLERAGELADRYASVKPQEYILPLNAMAGFCRPCDK
jgi:hypothetical protein